MNARYIPVKEVAKLMRAALKKAFPKVKFSVRCDKYSGGCSIDVRYENGPLQKDVEAVVGVFQSKGFDGMIDMAYSYNHWLSPEGEVALAVCEGTEGSMGTVPAYQNDPPFANAELVYLGGAYVFVRREISDAVRDNVKAAWAAMSPLERNHFIYGKIVGQNREYFNEDDYMPREEWLYGVIANNLAF